MTLAAVHGHVAVIKLNATDYSIYGQDFTFDRSVATHDTTAFGSTSISYITGLLDGDDFTINLFWDPTIYAAIIALFATVTTFELAPMGTTTSNRKISGSCIIHKISNVVKVNNVNMLPITLKKTGTIVEGVY